MNHLKSWPGPDQFLSLDGIAQMSDQHARCTGVAICNAAGQSTRIFAQGETAHFYYEFTVLDAIGVPCSGLELHDAAGQAIYGKNFFQCELSNPPPIQVGQQLRIHHTVKLELVPGDYSVGVGLSSLNPASYAALQQGALDHTTFAAHLREHCRMQHVGTFTVKIADHGRLSHYGIANLPDQMSVTVHQPADQPLPANVAAAVVPTSPTIFHVTHWKAGSQWIHRILFDCVPDLIIPPQIGEPQFLSWPIQPGKVYPTVYVTKQQFHSVQLPAGSRHFVVIRDLRDTLVSAYFSMKHSHPQIDARLAHWRTVLQTIPVEDGFIYLMDEWLAPNAHIQLSWQEAGEPLIRYEDLLTQDSTILERVLIDECQLPVTRERLQEVIAANRFENVTGQRKRGEEDLTSHNRKGIDGDWRNYFTYRVKQAFKFRFGGILIATGYETDLLW